MKGFENKRGSYGFGIRLGFKKKKKKTFFSSLCHRFYELLTFLTGLISSQHLMLSEYILLNQRTFLLPACGI